MKLKRFLSVALSVALLCAMLIAAAPVAGAEASSWVWNRYFREQLTADARVFYDAMVRMFVDGTFQSGTESIDLVQSGFLSQARAAAYMENPSAGGLLADFGAARDAFWADYPGVFYVDFSNLSVRATIDAAGLYHIYLGVGREDNYFTQGFTSRAQVESAINEYNFVLSLIVEEAKKATPRVGQSAAAAQVEFVHDALINGVSYKLEDVCTPENRGFIRTAYGALVKREGVCEAYTRAFKAAMDELGIPCVMVSGVYLHNIDTPEAHIWNYVQLDGKWYGVDATMDDPRPPKGSAKSGGVDGYESKEYLLRGEIVMGQKHFPSGIMSPVEYAFSYPALNVTDYGVESVTDDDGFAVSFKQDGSTDDGIAAGEFYISYRNMGCAAAREAGVWFLERFWTHDESGSPVPGDWHYILTDVYALDDHETYLHLVYPQVELVQFAVTRVAPGPYLEDPNTYMWYVGEASGIGAQSAVIHNENSGYKAPPYPMNVTPVMTLKMVIANKSYRVSVDYNDDLVRDPAYAAIGVSMSATAYNRKIKNIEQRAKIANIQWDGKRHLEFDFTPSEDYRDDAIIYKLTPVGLVGASSGKVPVEITYGAGHNSSYCPLGVGGFNWRVFGQPMLVDGSDLSMSGWTLSDGSTPSELLKSRLTLVASAPTPSQTEAMNDMIGGTGAQVLSSQTYNIQLTLCAACIEKIGNGQSLRIALGFPDGYGPEDEGVTFKAYHFIKDDEGNLVGVEEIPCTVTRYGLIIECYSFSPFAVAAVVGSADTSARGVILSGTSGGSVTSVDGNIFAVREGGSVTIRVQADAGKVIEALTVGNRVIAEAAGRSVYTLTLRYEDLFAVADNIVYASFVAERVYAADMQRGETAQVPPADKYYDDDAAGPGAPSDPSQPGAPGTSAQPSVPKTGDNDPVYLWLAMTLGSAAALCVRRRRRRAE